MAIKKKEGWSSRSFPRRRSSTGKRGRPAGVKSKKKATGSVAASEKVATVYKTEGGTIMFVENDKIMTKLLIKNGAVHINGTEVPARDCYLSFASSRKEDGRGSVMYYVIVAGKVDAMVEGPFHEYKDARLRYLSYSANGDENDALILSAKQMKQIHVLCFVAM